MKPIKALIIGLLAPIAFACQGDEIEEKVLREAYWIAYSIEGEILTRRATRQRLFVEFKREEPGRFVGYGGCNTIYGNYTLEGGSIDFTQLNRTRSTCPRIALEHAFVEALEQADRIRFRGDTLVMSSRREALVEFVPDAPQN